MSNPTPSHIVIHDGVREVVRITMEGRVTLGPGITADIAASAFWRAMEEASPGMCQRVLDERANRRKKLE